MNEAELLLWLQSRVLAGSPRRGEGRDLARRLLARLGHPQDDALGVHVVGTAGKGTVAALVTDRLAAAGIPVVTHMSPHVRDVRERFLVDGALPPWPVVLAAADAVAAAADDLEAESGAGPSYFAVTTAIAWELAHRRGAEVTVIEAGIGGRGDATNVMSRPDVLTVFTAIGEDHADVLGSSVEEIAREKAGVLAGRTTAVLGPQPDARAAEVIATEALAVGCRVHPVAGGVDWRADAIATSDAAVRLLESRLAWPVPALSPRLPPGRAEVVEVGDRRLVLDGAHNPMKLAALEQTLAGQPRPAVVVAALARSKDLEGCAAILSRLGDVVVCTEFGQSGSWDPPSHGAGRLAGAVAACGGDARPAPTPADAARMAWSLSGPGATILATGSFLHLHEVEETLRRG